MGGRLLRGADPSAMDAPFPTAGERRVADIFVSYTSSDRDLANWIGLELEKLGHVAHLHEWEISAGGNIPAWMEERHDEADHCPFCH
jgi:hypothetical protein